MKKLFYILCAATALLLGLWGCQQQKQEGAADAVDLRYRADDTYSLDAVGAKAFTLLVASSKPWTITSEHPDWCIISEEDGAPVDPAALHVGKAEPTTIRVQYYDNTGLDDRTDHIFIQSDGWTGKTVTVNQKGIAFLTIPEEDLALEVEKAGGELTIHVQSNQAWSSKVTEGEWISIADGETGEGEGTITVQAVENTSELRYAQMTVYDRHDVAMALIQFTQDGVQLVPLSDELRAGYDQLSAELEIVSNAKWTVEKASDADDWFTIDNPTGEGNGTIRLTLTPNEGTGLRKAEIIVKNVVVNPDDAQVEKPITVKQAYKINPVRVILDAGEMDSWKSDWVNAPVYTKDVGTLFVARSRLNRTMDFGSYTFRWKDIDATARVRHWFCFSDGIELKLDIRPASSKVSFDFNAASSGASTKPSLNAYTDLDFSQPVEISVKFDPSGAEHCHITYYVNGNEAASFDTSADVLHTVKWGSNINYYVGVDEDGGSGSKATCEWYEYTAPMNWDE